MEDRAEKLRREVLRFQYLLRFNSRVCPECVVSKLVKTDKPDEPLRVPPGELHYARVVTTGTQELVCSSCHRVVAVARGHWEVHPDQARRDSYAKGGYRRGGGGPTFVWVFEEWLVEPRHAAEFCPIIRQKIAEIRAEIQALESL